MGAPLFGIVGNGRMGRQLGKFLAQRLEVSVVIYAPNLTDTVDAMATAPHLVTHTNNLDALKDCQTVIEAVPENLAVKQQVFTALETVVYPSTLLATNTSTLSVTEIGSVLRHPSRLIGLHFFNPVSRMRLVEVIAGAQTSEPTVDAAIDLVTGLGHTPIECADRPGFVVNRLLMLVLEKGGADVANGVSVEAVNETLAGVGLPLGLFEYMTLIGREVFDNALLNLRKNLGPNYCTTEISIPAALKIEIEKMLNEKVVANYAQLEQCLKLGANWRLPDVILE